MATNKKTANKVKSTLRKAENKAGKVIDDVKEKFQSGSGNKKQQHK